MSKFLTVFFHTYLSNAKSKSFIISTLITAAIIVVVLNLPNIFAYFDKEDVQRVAVVDQTEIVYQHLLQEQQLADDATMEFILFEDEASAKESFDTGVVEGIIAAILENNSELRITYYAEKANPTALSRYVEQSLNQLQFTLKATQMGIAPADAAQLFQPVAFERIALAENAKTEEELVQSYFLVYILLFAIYFSVLMYVSMVAMEVAKEKSSRVMEILVSSVHPIYQMFGKIIGIAFLGLTQIAIFVVIGAIILNTGSKQFDIGDMVIDLSTIPVEPLIYAFIFYLLAYMMYATIGAMLGSIVSRIEEVQQMMTPFTLVVVVGFVLAMYGLTNPDVALIKVTSFIPLFTPMIMFLRVGMSDPALWEIWVSIGGMLVTIVIFGWLAARIYKGGVLMYGKSASLKDFKKALQLHKDN